VKGEIAYKIRRRISPSAQFCCEMCGKNVFRAGKYQYQSLPMVGGYTPRLFNAICRDCIYGSSFGSKFKSKAMKARVIENG